MNDTHILRVEDTATQPEISRPDSSKILSGDPVHTSWNLEGSDGLYCGIWQSTPGKWRISYDEWEYCILLSGVSVLTQDGFEPQTFKAGDSFILRSGFEGTWEVLETTRKNYVIKLP
jgi:uncharacterized protein